MPAISIVVPVYKVEQYLELAAWKACAVKQYKILRSSL